MRAEPLSPEAIAALRRQGAHGRLAFPIVGPLAVGYLRLLRRNRVEGVAEARRVYRRALAERRPVLVCANHLTMIDSVVLHHALASLGDYLTDFRRFAWNVPAVENFKRSAFLSALTYLSKCVPVDRAGSAAHHGEVLETLRHLAARGEVCTLFPEGGRSRSGRVEPAQVTYGVGHILQNLERPMVLCAYVRGARQVSWSALPERGDTLHVAVRVIEPSTTDRGLRGARELARQVIETLKAMEDAYFSRMDRGYPTSA